MNEIISVHTNSRNYITMKNKNNGAINRAKKKHAKNVARKGKGAQYGKTLSTFNQIKKLKPAQDYNMIAGVDSKHTDTTNKSTMFTDTASDTITIA